MAVPDDWTWSIPDSSGWARSRQLTNRTLWLRGVELPPAEACLVCAFSRDSSAETRKHVTSGQLPKPGPFPVLLVAGGGGTTQKVRNLETQTISKTWTTSKPQTTFKFCRQGGRQKVGNLDIYATSSRKQYQRWWLMKRQVPCSTACSGCLLYTGG